MNKNWLVLYTKPRAEFKAYEDLIEMEIETYLPYRQVENQWSDRKKNVKKLLFTSYIFIYANELERLKAITSRNIVTTIMHLGKPAVIPESDIERLRRIVESQCEIYITYGLKIGDKVRIIDGPLAEMEGILVEVDSKKLFTVNIELLNRSISIKITPEYIQHL